MQIAGASVLLTGATGGLGGAIARARRDRGEVDVAPLGLRLGAMVSGLAPGLATGVSRRLGSEEIARQFEAAQRDRR